MNTTQKQRRIQLAVHKNAECGVRLKNFCLSKVLYIFPPWGVLGISSDGDDRRIFFGLKFSIPAFLGVQKFGKYFFGYLDLSRDFLGVLKRIGSALAA